MHSLIRTQRLVLSRPVMEELEEYFYLFSRPELHVYNPAGPDSDSAQTEETLQSWVGDWERDGVGYFTVRLRDELREEGTPALVGYVGVAKRHFDEQTEVLNLAYRIHLEHQGRGVVTEACRAVLSSARELYPELPIRAYTKAENSPSRKVVERLGFTHRTDLDDFPEPGDVNYFLPSSAPASMERGEGLLVQAGSAVGDGLSVHPGSGVGERR